MARHVMLKVDSLSALLAEILGKARVGILSEIGTDTHSAAGLLELDAHFLEPQGLRHLLAYLRGGKPGRNFRRATFEICALTSAQLAGGLAKQQYRENVGLFEVRLAL